MYEVLELSSLSDGVRRLLKPLLVGFKVIMHLVLGDIHCFLDEFFIVDVVFVIH